LSLNNSPKAAFRYDIDSIVAWIVEFTDLSYYEPETWSWDFGDGTNSNEKYPIHQYDNTGSYQVCLTVSNINGSNTYCKTLFLGVTPATELHPKSNVYFVNAVSELVINKEKFKKIFIYNNLGELKYQNLFIHENKINLQNLVSGSYFWKAIGKNGENYSGSFIKYCVK
jgi:PKD repeat protein